MRQPNDLCVFGVRKKAMCAHKRQYNPVDLSIKYGFIGKQLRHIYSVAESWILPMEISCQIIAVDFLNNLTHKLRLNYAACQIFYFSILYKVYLQCLIGFRERVIALRQRCEARVSVCGTF